MTPATEATIRTLAADLVEQFAAHSSTALADLVGAIDGVRVKAPGAAYFVACLHDQAERQWEREAAEERYAREIAASDEDSFRLAKGIR